MTREEAIKHLKEWKEVISIGRRKEVIDMAIEALKDVQNCVHCEHYTEVETNTGIHGECKMDTAHNHSEIPTGSCDTCKHKSESWGSEAYVTRLREERDLLQDVVSGLTRICMNEVRKNDKGRSNRKIKTK